MWLAAMQAPEEALQKDLATLAAGDLYRRRRVVTRRHPGARVVVEGRELVDFCSNDYLGLAHDQRLADAMRSATLAWGTGATSAHLVTGHTAIHHELEDRLAAFTGRDRALLFSTGYMANLGVVTALAGRHDLVVEDRLNHASLIDAARLTGATTRRYRHADPQAASRRLEDHHGRRRLIVTDGVFSMDGDIAPLRELAAVADTHNAWLVVDDAHGLGVLGAGGGGSLEVAGVGPADAPVLVGTFGKAFGTFGAFVAGSATLIETLIQRARTYIYTTAPPPAVTAATLKALEISVAEPDRRARLQTLIERFRAGASQLGIGLTSSPSPIQPILVGDAAAALRLSNELFHRGFWVTAIRPPTVPAGSSRLRVTLSAIHEPSDVDNLLDALSASLAFVNRH
jgi:8-amino-7-oxononanoate synthase